MSAEPEKPLATAQEASSAPTAAEVKEPVGEQEETESSKDPAGESTEKATEKLADLKLDPAEEKKETEEAKVAPTEGGASSEKAEEAGAASSKIEEPTKSDTVAPPSSSDPTWPETGPDHPLTKFFDAFEDLTKQADYNEVYGITLSKSDPFHTKLILQKYLRANANDLTKAKEQLLETLKWRKSFDPLKAQNEKFSKQRFDGLGWILRLVKVPGSENEEDVVTFNIYGAVKDNKVTFGDIEGFLRWRVGLMEKSIHKLNLQSATKPIPDYGQGPDPYQGYQVHDYLQVSFLRQDPHVKAATKKTLETLGRYYPETLSRKFFVNVPVIMGWMFSAAKLLISKETVKKFTVLSYGEQLASELGTGIPKAYGGSAGELFEIGEGMHLEA